MDVASASSDWTALDAAVGEIAGGPVWSLSDEGLAGEIARVFTADQRLQARLLTLVAEADGRDLADRLGATSTASWLMFKLAYGRREASRTVELARTLASNPSLESTVSTLAAGDVNVEQARIIARTVRDLPDEVGSEGKTRCARLLTELAVEKVRPETLAAHRSMILEQVAPEIAEEALRRELERAERTAYERRGLTFTKYGEGEYRLRGILPSEAAAIVRAAMDPLCVPGARTEAANDVADPATIAARDPRSPAARRADALTEVCRRALAHGDLPDNGGEKPHLVITMNWERLRDSVAGAVLDTGDLLTAATARRLACDALIIPAVLGGQSQPLDLGRARRLIDGPLRRALVLRDHGCAFPGCDRPPAWCDGHHIESWVDGGHTSLANAVLLCGHHHRVVHRGDWLVRIGPAGHPEFMPPHYIDRERKPIRNNVHRRS